MNKKQLQEVQAELKRTIDNMKVWERLADWAPLSDAIRSRRKALKALKAKIKNKAI